MNSFIQILLLIIFITIQGCTPCQPLPSVSFAISLTYKTKEDQNLISTPAHQSDTRYDGDKIEVAKLYFENGDKKTETLSVGGAVYDEKTKSASLRVKFPVEDARIHKLLIYLKPTDEVDTISYQGLLPYNFPQPKTLFYNSVSMKEMELTGNSSSGSEYVHLHSVVRKP